MKPLLVLPPVKTPAPSCISYASFSAAMIAMDLINGAFIKRGHTSQVFEVVPSNGLFYVCEKRTALPV